MNNKKVVITGITILIIIILSACIVRYHLNVNSKKTSNSRSTYSSNLSDVITKGKQFKITGDNTNRKYHYYIYDKNYKVVDEGDIERMPPTITYVSGNIMKICFHGGTHADYCKYYNAKSNTFSQEYWYPVIEKNSIIVYFDNDKNSKKLIIRDIFNKDKYYKEYYVDYSGAYAQVSDAEFINGDTKLKITYLKGEDFKEVTEVFNL